MSSTLSRMNSPGSFSAPVWSPDPPAGQVWSRPWMLNQTTTLCPCHMLSILPRSFRRQAAGPECFHSEERSEHGSDYDSVSLSPNSPIFRYWTNLSQNILSPNILTVKLQIDQEKINWDVISLISHLFCQGALPSLGVPCSAADIVFRRH